MMWYRTDCIERPLSKLFGKFGKMVGKDPMWFIIIPLLISVGLGTGLLFLQDREDNDIERQFTPYNGPSKKTREFVKEHFPSNDSVFSSQRLYEEGNYGVLIASTRDGGNILIKHLLEEIIRLNDKVSNISVKIRGKHEMVLDFNGLCSTANNKCISNPFLDIIKNDAAMIEKVNLTFPMYVLIGKPVFLGSTVGGVKESQGIVQHAEAIRIFYFLKNVPAAYDWLKAFHKTLSSETASKNLRVSHFTSLSRQEEVQKHTADGLPLFSITYVLSIAFSVLSCMRLDSVRNRLFVAFVGVLSAGLAVVSSFGLLLYAGIPFVTTVANSPFLILGIGVDDMFIMLANWQQTKVHDSVPQRMSDTYKEAAMSITITTLTNVLGFYIGLTSDFPSVQAFCMYTSTAIIFCFLYNISFFGGFLALNGWREAKNRHWLTCKKIPTQNPEGKSKAYALFCTGGNYNEETGAEKVHPFSRFFKTYYGPFLTKPISKICVMLLYAGYLAGSIYGCFHLQQGTEMKHLAADDSYVIHYYDDEKKYFSNYGPNIMVLVAEEFPYWDKNKRSQLNLCLENFNNLDFIKKELFTSWLDTYLTFAQYLSLDVNNEQAFKRYLPSFFWLFPEFKMDVSVTDEGRILASRFFVQTTEITNASIEIRMFNELRRVAKNCTATTLLAFNPMFIFLDQYSVIVMSTILNVGVTAAVMLAISLLLIPNPLCSFWVTFSIGSVITGVTGFMALWGVNLDSISMIILVVCIGFTVDFSAHISYAFVSSEKAMANERAVDALFTLGYPILQGATSTIIGVVVLATSKNHIFRTFFKIMFLVMIFGLVHAIVFIPVLLTWLSCSGKDRGKETKRDKETATGNDVTPHNVKIEMKTVSYDNQAFVEDWSVQVMAFPIFVIQDHYVESESPGNPECPQHSLQFS